MGSSCWPHPPHPPGYPQASTRVGSARAPRRGEVLTHQLLDLSFQLLDVCCGHATESHASIQDSTSPLNSYAHSGVYLRSTTLEQITLPPALIVISTVPWPPFSVNVTAPRKRFFQISLSG